MRGLGSGSLVFPAIVLFGFSHAMGAYVGPRYWTIFFLVMVATRLARAPAGVAETRLMAPPDAPFAALGTAPGSRS